MKTLYLDHKTQIPYTEIIFFEHHNHYLPSLRRVTLLHTTTQIYILKDSIRGIYKVLDASIFMLPHQSFIVNMAYIKMFQQLNMVLDNGIEIPISIKRSSYVRIQFLEYIKKETL